MAIEVKCPNRDCDQQLALTPDMAGRKGKCPKCGKTFQIPQTLGQRRTQAAAGARAEAPVKKQPDVIPAAELSPYLADEDDLFAAEPAQSPRRRRPAAPTAEVIDDYEADPVVDEVYEEPRPVRRRRYADDRYADDRYADNRYQEQPVEDEDDDVPRYGGKRGGGGISKARRWMLGSVGFLILAISMCVLGGANVFLLLSEAFAQIGMGSGSAAVAKAAATFLKVSQVVWLLATIAVLTGYSFCLFIPNKRATLGLTIAAVSVCVMNLIMGIIFRFVPVVGERSGVDAHLRSVMAGWWGGLPKVGDELLTLFIELSIVAELMLLSLLLAEVARAQKDRHHKADCMRVVWFLTGLAGTLFVMFMFMFFIDGSDFTLRIVGGRFELQSDKKWMLYIVRIFNWACNGLLVLSSVFLILNLFHTRKATA